MTLDNAGNTLGTVRKLNLTPTTQTFTDFVGASDTNDFYSFSLSGRSSLTLNLGGLSANADVQIIQDKNSNGVFDGTSEVITGTTSAGTTAESIITTLDTGNYFIRVYPRTGANTNYSLGVSATQAPVDLAVNALATAIPHSKSNHKIDFVLEPFIQALVQNVSQTAVKEAALPLLQGIFSNPNLSSYSQIAFGDGFDQNKFNTLKAFAFDGSLNVLPNFSLLSGEVMGDAKGAFSAQTHSIYFNSNFIIQNLNNFSVVADVLVEELGHSIDSMLGTGDAQGDEGEIFALLMRNGLIDQSKLQALKTENDSATIIIDGQHIAIEQARIDGWWWGETLIGTDSIDEIYGNGGNDRIEGRNGDDRIWGGQGNDKIWGENGNDRIIGDDGDDEINGGGNNDFLWGSQGNDKLWGEDGGDELRGDDGNDELRGGGNNDILWGGNGNDKLWGENDNDVLYGENGDDELNGGNNDDYVWGGFGNDKLWGENGSDRLIGDEGDDEVRGGGNDDFLWGSQGHDRLWGEDGNDELRGDDGNDELRAGGNNDKLWGGNGDDKLWGENDNDELYGESGNDELNGGNNDDRIFGGSGNDKLWGEIGNDALYGDDGDDILDAYGHGNDEKDVLAGWAGRDRFILGNLDNAYYRRNGRSDFAEIWSFNREEDTIQLKSLSNRVSNGTNAYGYRLVTVGSDTEIRLNININIDINDDLIAILKGVTGISLTGKGFVFDGNSSQEIIKQLYRDVFGREADPGGLQISSNQLIDGSMSYEQIRRWYANSNETTDNLNRIYSDVLLRPADQDGLNFYRNSLATGNTFAQVISSIATSQEAKKFWTVQYYNNTNVNGDVVFAQSVASGNNNFSLNWGNGSPNSKVKRDDFSARAMTKRYFAPGIFEIQTTSDDGVRVWINNQLVIDKWINQASTSHYNYFNSNGGTFDVTIDYYEYGGDANLGIEINANPINGLIGSKYRELGGASSLLGLPTGREFSDNDNITIRRQFKEGQIVNNKLTGETEAIYHKDDLPSWLRYESLAKDVDKIYLDPKKDQPLDQPFNYRLDKLIINKQTGFYAIGLISKSLNDGRPPVLVFRGTDPTEAKDVLDDLNSQGIGRRQFDFAEIDILNWLNSAYEITKMKPDVIGHSLGGALAQLTASKFTSKIAKVITFNSPGINANNVIDFENRGGRNLQVVHYITKNDPVSFGGQRFLPGIMIQTQGQELSSLGSLPRLDLLNAYLAANLASHTTTKLTSTLVNNATAIYYNHVASVVKLPNRKEVIPIRDFEINNTRYLVEKMRAELGKSLTSILIGDILNEEIIKSSIIPIIRRVAK